MKVTPFHDLKIIDLSTVLAGPSVGTFFAELGAKVLKIEHPIHGDVTNTWRLAKPMVARRNKRSKPSGARKYRAVRLVTCTLRCAACKRSWL